MPYVSYTTYHVNSENALIGLLLRLRQWFLTFSSRGTFETLLNFCRNLDTKNSTNLRIRTKPCKELTKPVGSAEPRLKKTVLRKKNSIGSGFGFQEKNVFFLFQSKQLTIYVINHPLEPILKVLFTKDNIIKTMHG